MVQDSTTYYVWIGGPCDYGHKEPTNEARAESQARLGFALQEGGRRSQPTHEARAESQARLGYALQGGGRRSQRAGGAAVVIELMEQREQSQRELNSAESRQKKTKSQHDGSIIVVLPSVICIPQSSV